MTSLLRIVLVSRWCHGRGLPWLPTLPMVLLLACCAPPKTAPNSRDVETPPIESVPPHNPGVAREDTGETRPPIAVTSVTRAAGIPSGGVPAIDEAGKSVGAEPGWDWEEAPVPLADCEDSRKGVYTGAAIRGGTAQAPDVLGNRDQIGIPPSKRVTELPTRVKHFRDQAVPKASGSPTNVAGLRTEVSASADVPVSLEGRNAEQPIVNADRKSVV